MAYKLEIRKNIYHLFQKLPKREIVRLFSRQIISRTNIYKLFKNVEGIPCMNRPKSGRVKQLNNVQSNRL